MHIIFVTIKELKAVHCDLHSMLVFMWQSLKFDFEFTHEQNECWPPSSCNESLQIWQSN